jgi:acetyltransferase-like isoleucine patch superfamily enzyme
MSMKSCLRDFLTFAGVLLTFPLWLGARIERLAAKSDAWFASCGQFLSLFPGLLGIFLRRGYYCMTLDSFSRDCSVGFGAWFSHPQCKIGANVYIGARCILGLCDIGDETLIGSNVDLLSGRHQHHFNDGLRPIREQGGTFSKVTIGRNCWIGNSAVVMADVGENCIVGAGSVIVKPIPPNSVAMGNPAIIKKTRGSERKIASPVEVNLN